MYLISCTIQLPEGATNNSYIFCANNASEASYCYCFHLFNIANLISIWQFQLSPPAHLSAYLLVYQPVCLFVLDIIFRPADRVLGLSI